MTSYFDRKPSPSVRPGLSHLQPDPSSPHTPQRQFSSAFSSPSVSYRVEEEAVIFELGNRHLSAGFAGESSPRCNLGFGPEDSRRTGDHRRWLPGFDERPRKRRCAYAWGDDYELWRLDMRGFDLGLVEDKVERALREAYNKYLLLDSRARKVYLIIPSVLPHQLLNRVLHTLFEHSQMPSITLLSPSILATVAAGCRSGLVVDIGWRETIVTAVYEYREVCQCRTIRGMRLLSRNIALMLERCERQSKLHSAAGEISEDIHNDTSPISVHVEQAEEATARMAWCRQRSPKQNTNPSGDMIPPYMDVPPMTESSEEELKALPTVDDVQMTSIPSPFSPRKSLEVQFAAFADVVQDTLFASPDGFRHHDDHEQPLPRLIFKSMVSLPPDVRSVCMSRIMVAGGGSNIPGLKSRIIDEVAMVVDEHGWDPVCGKATDIRRQKLKEMSANRQAQRVPTPEDKDDIAALPASLIPQVHDHIEENLRQGQEKYSKPTVSGRVRGVETLGAWAGCSLLASLRIKGIVEIEKDVFLQHGLGGAKKENDSTSKSQRKGNAADMSQAGIIGQRTSWTLGAWA